MNLWLTFRLSLSRIAAAKVRSGLTMLGIIIGVGAVVALTAVGQGAQQGIDDSLASLGANQITVSATTPTGLEEIDAEAIGGIEGVLKISTQVNSFGTASYGSESVGVGIVGVSASYFDVANPDVALGTFLPSSPGCKTPGPLWCPLRVQAIWVSPSRQSENRSGSMGWHSPSSGFWTTLMALAREPTFISPRSPREACSPSRPTSLRSASKRCRKKQ